MSIPFFTVCAWHDPLSSTPSNVGQAPAGQTIGEFVASTTDAHIVPTLIIHNGELVLEEHFDRVIEEHDVVSLIPMPGVIDPATWFVIGIAVVLSAAAVYMVLTAPVPEEFDRRSTTYSLSYRGNRRKPGQPIPVVYGKMRTYPDITGSYTYFNEEGDQFLVQLFDVSQGKCDITDIQYEDTPVSSFDSEGAELEILMPGQASDLFPHEVFVSSEVENVEPPHEAGSFSPFYVAQPPGETINAIELDIVAPNGIYSLSTEGDLRSHTRTVGLWAYHVDAEGNQTTFYAYRSLVLGGAKSTNAIRRTARFKVPKGRYGVKVQRVNDVDPRQRYSTLWTWNGLRGFSSDKSPVTTTTRVALRVRASESLGNASLGQFNVLAERYLPSWSPGTGWSAQPVKTTNAMAAFADILRANYGARVSDKQIDLQTLYDLSLRPLADFNGVFDEEITVWEALNTVCLPLLARPIELPGGIYSAVADDPAVAPSALFTMRNIIAGTFGVQHVGVLESTNDSVEVTYSNASEGYRQTSILCKPAGEAGDNPKRVDVKGVTSKEAAYEVGIRMANENKWRRKLISFETGLEGYLPTFGDTIRVHHYLLGLEQATPAVSGEAKAYDVSEGGITVWEDLSHLVGKTGLQVYLRGKQGEPFGPVSCTVPSMHFIDFTGSTSGWTPVFSDSHAGPLYCVGKASDFMALVKVTNTEPLDRHRVRIEGAVDNPNVYIKGAQPEYSPINLPAKLFPRIENLTWTHYGRDSIKVSWKRIHGDYAIVEQSLDGGTTWDQIFKTDRNFVTGVPPRLTNYKVRVAGVSVFQGPWSYLTIDTVNYTLTPPPMTRLRLSEAFDGKELRVTWDKPPAGFVPFFEVWWNGAKKVTYTLAGGATQATLPYTNVMAVEATSYGGLTLPKDGSRTLTIKGFYKSESGALSTTPAVLVAKNPQLAALYGAGYTERGANLNIYFDLPSTGDFAWAEVYLSQTAGFTPGPSTLVGRYSTNDINLVGILAHATPYYLRIAGVDVWGRDGIVYSNEVMITTEDAVIDGTISYSQITGSKPPIDATRNIVYYQSTAPTGGQVGDYWYNTATGRLNQYVSGTGWTPISTNQKTFSRTTPPANPADNLVAGDMWHDSDSPNETLYRWDGSAWVLVATNGTTWDTIGFRPSDAELLNSLQEWDHIKDSSGKRPANNATKNTFYRQNIAPAGVVGDLWYCTQTGSGYIKDVLYRYSGSAWTDYGNGYYDTGQLQDGAELGKKADWSRILNDGGKPENNATKNTITYGSVAPGTGTSGDLFVDSDTGLMYKWEVGGWKLVASSIQVYQQDSQPSAPYDGDLWYDTGADNVRKEMRRYVAAQAAWQVVATKGATWSVDIAGQPSDAVILNAYQEWDQIQDSTGKRPANNATKNTLYRQNIAPVGAIGDLWYCTQTGGGYTRDVLYQYSGTAWVNYGNGYYDTSQLADGAELGKKADWSRILNDGGKPENNATKNTITYGSIAPGSGTSGDLFVDSDTGLMYKWEGGGWKLVASSIQVFQQDAQPATAYEGDLWYDTGADNPRKEMKRYNGTAWQVVSTKGATWGVDLMGQPTDAALLNSLQEWNDIKDSAGAGKPANFATRNTFFKQAAAPAGVTGDLWYCTQTGGGYTKDVLYRWSGSAWTDYGNGYFDTSQLADGAELGKKADWSRILNDGGKPENNATKNNITYASNPPGSGTSGDLFVDSDTGLMYKWEGGTWKLVASSIQVYQQDGQPATAYAGDLWYDTGADNTRKEMRRYDGSAWQVVATKGATWSVDLTGQPSDAALLNSLQEWDQIQGAGKPVSNATRNRIFYATGGGSAPLSSLQVEYQLKEYGSGTTFTASADTSGKGDTLSVGRFVSGAGAWTTGAGGRGIVWGSLNDTTNYSYLGIANIHTGSTIGPAMTGKRQWSLILVTESVVSESASIYGSVFVMDRVSDADDVLQFGFTVNSAGAVRVTWGGSHSVTWANAGAHSGRKVWHVVMDLDAAGVARAKLYKDGVLQTATTDNSGGTAPNYTASSTVLLLGANNATTRNLRGGALYYAAMYDGALNSSQITATLSALAANDDTSLLSGGGGAEPAGANGDIWYNPSTKVLAQHNGSAWVAIGNDFRDTSLLADGAGLGTKADWSKVFDDGGRPANGATVNTFYYQDVAPTAGNAGDLWFEGDTGFVYKREAGAWLPVATNVYIFRQTTVPTNGNVGDLWYDTDDVERPLYRLRVKPSSTFANWDRIATDGASWNNVTNKPDLAAPSGDKGSLLVDGTLDKTAAAGDLDFNRYFTYIGSSAYVKLYSDAKLRLFELKASGSDAGLYDKKKYKASEDQTIYVSFRALKVSATGSSPTLRIGGRIYDKTGAVLGLDYYTVNVSAISSSTWLWFHGSFKVSRADSFAIEPGFWINGVTAGTVYVDDVFIGYAPARVTSASMPAFMEALAVDSLYIANQAVTIPQYFFSENIQSFSATGNPTAVYFNIMSGPITFVDSGSVALFTCTVQIYGAAGYTQTDGSKYIQLLRGSTVLRRLRLYTEVGSPNNTLPGVFTFNVHDPDHGTGSPTYSLQIGVSSPSAGGTMWVHVKEVAISVIEARK